MPQVNALVRSGQYLCAENNLNLSQRMKRNLGKRDGPRAKLYNSIYQLARRNRPFQARGIGNEGHP
ncbi:hypothetical protein ACVWW6_000426 [Bradyrhizobium sp. USDA 3311]